MEVRTEAQLCWDGASKRALARRLSRKQMCDAGDPCPGLAAAVIAAEGMLAVAAMDGVAAVVVEAAFVGKMAIGAAAAWMLA